MRLLSGIVVRVNGAKLVVVVLVIFPSGKRLNVGSSPTVGAVFSAMKAEYVVVAEQAHPLGPAYSFPKYNTKN